MEGKRPTMPGHREDTVANDSAARQGHQGWHNTHAPLRTRSARERALVLPATSRPVGGSRELGIACGRGGAPELLDRGASLANHQPNFVVGHLNHNSLRDTPGGRCPVPLGIALRAST